MTFWLINPRDPLIFRDGRPFTAVPGSRATTIAFPFPSTIAGAIRTMAGTDASTGHFDKNRISELLEKDIRGPLLIVLDNKGMVIDWLLPAPADAVLFKTQDISKGYLRALSPITMLSEIKTDLQELNILGFMKIVKDKTYPNPPRFWYWKKFQKWLDTPKDYEITLKNLGINGPIKDNRVHVSIDPETQTGLPGALFQTSGLEFTHVESNEDELTNLSKLHELGMLIEADFDLSHEIGFLGGERRIVQWQKTDSGFKSCPEKIKQKILDQKRCRLILLTPGYFEAGYLPKRLQVVHGLNATIEAAAIPRYQTVSGWDYKISKPKPTRRLTPAGSVYFLKLTKANEQQIEKFIDSTWMQNVSDEEQARRDGFGLAVLGTWDSESREMEM
jgi:CRISPR-associated protein Cmr3